MQTLDARAAALVERTKLRKDVRFSVKIEEYEKLIAWGERWDESVAFIALACLRAGMAALGELQAGDAGYNPFAVYANPRWPEPPPPGDLDPSGRVFPPPRIGRVPAFDPQPPGPPIPSPSPAGLTPPPSYEQTVSEVERFYGPPAPPDVSRFLPQGSTSGTTPRSVSIGEEPQTWGVPRGTTLQAQQEEVAGVALGNEPTPPEPVAVAVEQAPEEKPAYEEDPVGEGNPLLTPFSCPTCGQACANLAGLKAHARAKQHAL